MSMGCGLIHCPDGMASLVGGECSCGGDGAPPLTALKPIRCYAIRCSEGQILTDDCACETIGQELPQPPGDEPPPRS